jgi:hypothetical protein
VLPHQPAAMMRLQKGPMLRCVSYTQSAADTHDI